MHISGKTNASLTLLRFTNVANRNLNLTDFASRKITDISGLKTQTL